MNTIDYKAAKLKEFDKKFPRPCWHMSDEPCDCVTTTINQEGVKNFLTQTIDELNAHWWERVKSLKFPEFQLKTTEQLNARIDDLLSEGKDETARDVRYELERNADEPPEDNTGTTEAEQY